MKLNEKMTELIKYFKKSDFEGFTFRLFPECQDMWGEDYALVLGFNIEPPFSFDMDNDYVSFDEDRLYDDLIEFIVHFLDFEKLLVFDNYSWNKNYGSWWNSDGYVERSDITESLVTEGTIVCSFMKRTGEIELYRKRENNAEG